MNCKFWKVWIVTFIEEPVRDERDVVVQVVCGDGQVAAAAAQLRAAVTRQDEVQPQLLDRTPVQLQRRYLQAQNYNLNFFAYKVMWKLTILNYLFNLWTPLLYVHTIANF